MWAPIEGYEGLYEVSDDARVRSLYRNGKELKPRIHKGYKNVCLSRDRKDFFVDVHRLVAKAFIPNPNNLSEVNHKNGIALDNRIENLEWCTHRQNMLHAWATGLVHNVGEDHPRAKLTADDVRKIRSMRATASAVDLAKKFGVSPGTIDNIHARRSWKRLDEVPA